MGLFNFTYQTLARSSEGIYREKGSKFIALALPVCTEEEVKMKLAEVKKQYYDARHHCYAYILGVNGDAFRLNDDGEPSGTAGRPIHGQLLSHHLTNTLIIVVRYFGGIKLGISGLINAYKTAAKNAIDNNDIIEKFVEEKYHISFPPLEMNKVMQLLKRDSVRITQQFYDTQSVIAFTIRKQDADALIAALEKIDGLTIAVDY